MRPLGKLLLVAALMGATGTQAEEHLSISATEGVYKHLIHTMNGAHEEYDEEEILELVRVSDSAAYFRTYVAGPNGHMCTMWGVAKKDGERLSYTKQLGPNEVCRFSINLTDNALVFQDEDGHCHYEYCGARAYLDGTEFTLKSKRSIRYIKTLLSSRQYKEELEEYNSAPK